MRQGCLEVKRETVDMRIIRVYMPTTEHSKEEDENMYEKIEQLLDDKTKSKDYTVVMGDLYAVVGEEVKKMDMSAIMVCGIVMIVDRC